MRDEFKKYLKEEIGGFLLNNGFTEMEELSYANDKCNVVFDDMGTSIANNDGDAMYSDGYQIYWIVGVLTWHGFIDKNYAK